MLVLLLVYCDFIAYLHVVLIGTPEIVWYPLANEVRNEKKKKKFSSSEMFLKAIKRCEAYCNMRSDEVVQPYWKFFTGLD